MSAPQASFTTYPSRIRTCNTALLTLAPQATFGSDTGRQALSGPNSIVGPNVHLRSASNTHRVLNTRSATAAANYYAEADDYGDHRSTSRTPGGGINSPSMRSTPDLMNEMDLEDSTDFRGFVDAPPPPHLIKPKYAHNVRQWIASDEQLAGAAEFDEFLVPIRLDLEVENYRLKDAFIWNMNEALITPDFFAQILCADLDISPTLYANQISNSIRMQIEEYTSVANVSLPEDQEFKVCVNLQINFWKHSITDKFEWNLNSPLAPEEFAKRTCADIGLSGECIPAIAHAIYEDILELKKEFIEGAYILDIQNDMPEGLEAGVRVDTENFCSEWQPQIELLSREDMERREVDKSREIRRLRRETFKFSGYSNERGSERSRHHNEPKVNGKESHDGSGNFDNVQRLSESERLNWRCSWCMLIGTGTWAVRSGPRGPKALCNICGIYYITHESLPAWRHKMYLH